MTKKNKHPDFSGWPQLTENAYVGSGFNKFCKHCGVWFIGHIQSGFCCNKCHDEYVKQEKINDGLLEHYYPQSQGTKPVNFKLLLTYGFVIQPTRRKLVLWDEGYWEQCNSYMSHLTVNKCFIYIEKNKKGKLWD